MSGVISYPRTDGSDRFRRDLEHLETLIVQIEQSLSMENLEGILALIGLIGWDRLPEHLRIRYLGLLAQKSRELELQQLARRDANNAADRRAEQKLQMIMQDMDRCLIEHCPWEARRDQEPLTVVGVQSRIENARQRIDEKGYQPLFSDEEILALAQTDIVAQARYKVRFMERKYFGDRGKNGFMGMDFTGASGPGVKYWNTSFGQIEDADSDYRLVANKLGLEYKEGCEYMLLVIDSQKAQAVCESSSISATFEKLGAFANHELPELYPQELTREILTAAFQAEYRTLYAEARVHWGGIWNLTDIQFHEFLQMQKVEPEKAVLLLERLRMHKQLGNNEYFRGDGMTANLIEGSQQQYGVVELFSFDKKKIELDAYLSAGAIHIV
ncbi:PAAR-like protein [Pseudomonas cichorii]|uniref:PAAR-like protein n=1 Tax=Pseudomonas cichorii TaxID=36746 RepID=A0A3M4LS83_PSECI|nr:hypothetical protein [Pseudomonas cichorii]RMQ44362.1 PAAR-like protein [Pseudomonas cichorii]